MKRAAILVAITAASVFVPIMAFAPSASAACGPPNGYTYFQITNKSFAYYPTNIESDWVSLRYGGSINYTKTKTMEVNSTASSTVTAEASGIFASVSASVGFSVGKSLATTQQWSYTANVPADTKHKYRLHDYHYTVTFTVTKKQFVASNCTYKTVSGWPQRVYHAPAKASRNVWRLDKADA